LLGPRQVGKSTLIKDMNPDLSINLSDEKTFLDFRSNPGELEERLSAGNYKTVFVDEIQRHPSLLNTIQAIVDDQKQGQKTKFYLSGSSARKLKRGQANLLPGRIFSYELGPLVAAELEYKLNIERALRYGCLPEAYLTKDDKFSEKLLTTYAGVYLKEEIQAEALTRNLDAFSRFIFIAASTCGKILDFSKLAKLARIERKNCSRFYEILEDTLIGQRVEVFEKTNADVVRRPKFYFFDPGVLNGLLENFNVSIDRKGEIFEGLVFAQLLASAKAHDKKVTISYFRTRGGFEVDFIVEMKEKIYAIEVKYGRVSTEDARHLQKIKDYDVKFDGLFIVGLGAESKKIGDVRVCNLNILLQELDL
jgi:uncharacterized protein